MTLRAKILILLSSALLLSTAAAGFALFRLVRAGDELRLITDTDSPLVRVLSEAAAGHLEQAIRFERALRFGSRRNADYDAAKREFEHLAASIWRDLRKARGIVRGVLEGAGDDRRRREAAASVLTLLDRLDAEHNEYAHEVRGVFAKFDDRKHRDALRLASQIEERAHRFDQTLGRLLVETSTFTEAASIRAKANERSAIVVTSVLCGLGLLLSAIVFGVCVRLLSEIRSLSGLLPICSNCKRIRDDRGYWNQLEQYVEAHSQAAFTHGLCADCQRKIYAETARAGDAHSPTPGSAAARAGLR